MYIRMPAVSQTGTKVVSMGVPEQAASLGWAAVAFLGVGTSRGLRDFPKVCEFSSASSIPFSYVRRSWRSATSLIKPEAVVLGITTMGWGGIL